LKPYQGLPPLVRRPLGGSIVPPILNRYPSRRDTFATAGLAGAAAFWDVMEDFFEFMFGASGRINRAKYWVSLVKFSLAGLLVAVILFTTAGIAAPLLIVMAVITLIPWLLWGFAITTERLHDRDKSAWWLAVFCLVPGLLNQLAKNAWFAGTAGTALHYILALAAFALTIWGFVEIGCLRGTAGSNTYGPDPLLQAKRRS
jgi:uncharacterized membrane protein YhaH (DUF805 family)